MRRLRSSLLYNVAGSMVMAQFPVNCFETELMPDLIVMLFGVFTVT